MFARQETSVYQVEKGIYQALDGSAHAARLAGPAGRRRLRKTLRLDTVISTMIMQWRMGLYGLDGTRLTVASFRGTDAHFCSILHQTCNCNPPPFYPKLDPNQLGNEVDKRKRVEGGGGWFATFVI